MRELPQEHQCAWREEAEELAVRLTTLEHQMEKMARVVFGQSSEKMLPPEEELRREAPRRSRDAEKEKRRLQAEAKAALPTREIRKSSPGPVVFHRSEHVQLAARVARGSAHDRGRLGRSARQACALAASSWGSGICSPASAAVTARRR